MPLNRGVKNPNRLRKFWDILDVMMCSEYSVIDKVEDSLNNREFGSPKIFGTQRVVTSYVSNDRRLSMVR